MMSWVAVLLRLPADVTRTPATSSSAAMISFFFQAEDGIRDGHVTGVQTCALPISDSFYDDPEAFGKEPVGNGPYRSEERRVGKECRSRRSPEHEKKKSNANERGDTTREQATRNNDYRSVSKTDRHGRTRIA